MKTLITLLIFTLINTHIVYAAASKANEIVLGDTLHCRDEYVRKDGSIIAGTRNASDLVTLENFSCGAGSDAGVAGYCDVGERAYLVDYATDTSFAAQALSAGSLDTVNTPTLYIMARYKDVITVATYYHGFNDVTKPLTAAVSVKNLPGAPDVVQFRVTCGIKRFGY
ncbi:MAG: hypothetical protein H7061_13675 [Bdellovibrionaceae bacterium]|nr:hypothetical protein [Bdellovibrio sp.]